MKRTRIELFAVDFDDAITTPITNVSEWVRDLSPGIYILETAKGDGHRLSQAIHQAKHREEVHIRTSTIHRKASDLMVVLMEAQR
jgi:hypothetical protein